MSTLSRYLRRFRRLVSPPGRPGPAAVPADRTADLREELVDVLMVIDAIEREADHLREEADELVWRRHRDAQEEADRILAQAREDMSEVRAEEAAQHRRTIEEEIATAWTSAKEEAAAVRQRAEGKRDDLAVRIAQRVLGSDIREPG